MPPTPVDDHTYEFEQLAGLAALGALEGDDQVRFEEHAARCERCRMMVQLDQEALARAAPEMDPSPDFKARLMQRAAAELAATDDARASAPAPNVTPIRPPSVTPIRAPESTPIEGAAADATPPAQLGDAEQPRQPDEVEPTHPADTLQPLRPADADQPGTRPGAEQATPPSAVQPTPLDADQPSARPADTQQSERTTDTSQPSPVSRPPAKVLPFWRRSPWASAIAALLVLGLFTAGAYSYQNQVVASYALSGTASGNAVVNVRRSGATELNMSGVQNPPPGYVYEAWIIPPNGQPVAAGTTPTGTATLPLSQLSSGTTVAVTQEQRPVEAPTSAPIMAVVVQS